MTWVPSTIHFGMYRLIFINEAGRLNATTYSTLREAHNICESDVHDRGMLYLMQYNELVDKLVNEQRVLVRYNLNTEDDYDFVECAYWIEHFDSNIRNQPFPNMDLPQIALRENMERPVIEHWMHRSEHGCGLTYRWLPNHSCDMCGARTAHFMNCRSCDFDECMACVETRRPIPDVEILAEE